MRPDIKEISPAVVELEIFRHEVPKEEWALWDRTTSIDGIPFDSALSQLWGSPFYCSTWGRWSWNRNTGRITADPQLMRNLGYIGDVWGLRLPKWEVLVHPSEVDRVLRELDDRVKGRTDRLVVEHRIKAARGMWYPLTAYELGAEKGPDGSISILVGIFLEHGVHGTVEGSVLSPLTLSPARLWEENLDPRIIIDLFNQVSYDLPIFIFLTDTSLRYSFMSSQLLDNLDIDAKNLLGSTDKDLFGEKADQRLEDACRDAMKNGKSRTEHTWPVEGELQTYFTHIYSWWDQGSGELTGTMGISERSWRELESSRIPGFEKKTDFEAEQDNLGFSSPAILDVLGVARSFAMKDSIVLLLGETGSGKDWLARFIHERSSRSNGPFFSINCASVPKEMAESELFGHEAWAFTGARWRKKGQLELAERGTLLLNEIGELSLELQAKLLTFLDTRTFTRVGGEKQVEVNARLIAATNRDLEQAVSDGSFRKDLFYRLNVLSKKIPPLREWIEDIEVLSKKLLEDLLRDQKDIAPPELSRSDLRKLKDYHWPGNVRELRNVLERALVSWRGGVLTLDPSLFEKEEKPEDQRLAPQGQNLEGLPRPGLPDEQALDEAKRRFRSLSNQEQGVHLKIMIEEVCGYQSGATRYIKEILGISETTIRNRLKEAGARKIDKRRPWGDARKKLIPKIEQYLIDKV